MRILVLNYEYPPLGGGAAPVCRQLCHAFAQRGHGVDVATMGFKGLPAYEEDGPVRVYRAPAFRKRQFSCETHEMVSFVVSALPRVIRQLRSGQYDVVHCHFIIPTGLLAYAATRVARVPYVLTAHGSDVPGYNADRFVYEHYFTKPLLHLILRNAALRVAPSRYLGRLLDANVGPYGLLHIPNCIDTDHFTQRPKQKRILMTGRLLRRKGFQTVLQALQGIETDYEVHISGEGPMRSELEALAKQVKAQVIFHGWLGKETAQLRELYETAAIYCLPSQRENASMALLEAMLAGAAVISSNDTGCVETIGDTGVLLPPGDVDAMRRALQELLEHPEKAAELGEKARSRVLEQYRLDAVADQYLAAFETVCRANGEKS